VVPVPRAIPARGYARSVRASPRPSRPEARRRRIGVSLIGGIVVATVLAAVLPRTLGPSSQATADASTSAANVPGTATPSDSDRWDDPAPEPIPAWLAWIPGGFPVGFAGQATRLEAFDAAAVVAGDTLWLTESRDADGTIVDRPTPPYRIPIDAFAVDPEEYGPFLPASVRQGIVAALRRGEAVLGSSSAQLRRLGSGATLRFGDRPVEVGAIAPDQLVGWSELLVAPDVGARLGIEHDRYLLARAQGLTLPGFRSLMMSLLPGGTLMRVERPGATRFVRVASGVNPPVVMKQVFGEFAAAPRSDDPAFFTHDPAWYETNIQTKVVPILGEVTCHRNLFPALTGALRELVDRGLDRLIRVYSGCFAARTVGGSSSAPPSQHAYGAAIDIDAPQNAMGDTTPAMDPRVVEVFERWGFKWGGEFVITDGMHFEYLTSPTEEAAA
jgi:hypothetical protein